MTSSRHDAIWVIVDRLTKSGYFLAVREDYQMERFKALGTQLDMNTAYHPQTGGVVRFGKRSKLSPRYVGPFEIVERVGPVAYRLLLPQELVGIHDTFYVSNLKKCLADVKLHVPLEEIKVDKGLCFVEEPIEVMDREVKKLKQSKIPIVKIRWNSRRGPKFTWELEDEMKCKYL
nr:reverse transcriptase domain-containing protein [Tanacetum cinerariifolium]